MMGNGGRGSGVRLQVPALCGFQEYRRGSTAVGEVATRIARSRGVTYRDFHLGVAESRSADKKDTDMNNLLMTIEETRGSV